MKITIIVSSNDPETVWNAFRFANTSLGQENEVHVFLLGKGVEAGVVSTLQYDIQEQLDRFRASGGTLVGCGVCCESRKDVLPTLQENLSCEIGSMQKLYSLVAGADKVLNF